MFEELSFIFLPTNPIKGAKKRAINESRSQILLTRFHGLVSDTRDNLKCSNMMLLFCLLETVSL